MAGKKPLESSLSKERKEFERLLLDFEKTWNEEVEKSIVALVESMNARDRDVRAKQAERLIMVLIKHDRNEKALDLSRYLLTPAKNKVTRIISVKEKIKWTERHTKPKACPELPRDIDAALWPNKKTSDISINSAMEKNPGVRIHPSPTIPINDGVPITPFGRDVVRLKVLLRQTKKQTIRVCAHMWNALFS